VPQAGPLRLVGHHSRVAPRSARSLLLTWSITRPGRPHSSGSTAIRSPSVALPDRLVVRPGPLGDSARVVAPPRRSARRRSQTRAVRASLRRNRDRPLTAIRQIASCPVMQAGDRRGLRSVIQLHHFSFPLGSAFVPGGRCQPRGRANTFIVSSRGLHGTFRFALESGIVTDCSSADGSKLVIADRMLSCDWARAGHNNIQ
jgi:hypothetical protein